MNENCLKDLSLKLGLEKYVIQEKAHD